MIKELANAIECLDKLFSDMYLTKETVLPKEVNGLKIKWESSDEAVVNKKCEIKEFIYERYVELKARIIFGDEEASKSYWCKVKAIDSSSLSEKEIVASYIDANIPEFVSKMNFNIEYKNITQSYGFINLFKGEEPKFIEAIIKDGLGNKSDEKRVSTEFICVHDTANQREGAGALAHSNFINNGGGGCSWHFSVGDNEIYKQVNDDEIAWHAGDGSRLFNMIDTKVKATALMPLITFSEDGYYVLGNEKTCIKLPDNTVNKRIGPYGIYTEIGANGNYYMNESYYNEGFGWLANCGGNRNSVGFESCVDMKSDYVKTFVNSCLTSVAMIRKYNLTVDRIMEHNNFSGKNCPQGIRQAGKWANFRDLCSSLKFGYDNLMDYSFEYETSEAIDEKGFIKLGVKPYEEQEIKVCVKKNNDVIYENTYKVVLK